MTGVERRVALERGLVREANSLFAEYDQAEGVAGVESG